MKIVYLVLCQLLYLAFMFGIYTIPLYYRWHDAIGKQRVSQAFGSLTTLFTLAIAYELTVVAITLELIIDGFVALWNSDFEEADQEIDSHYISAPVLVIFLGLVAIGLTSICKMILVVYISKDFDLLPGFRAIVAIIGIVVLFSLTGYIVIVNFIDRYDSLKLIIRDYPVLSRSLLVSQICILVLGMNGLWLWQHVLKIAGQ